MKDESADGLLPLLPPDRPYNRRRFIGRAGKAALAAAMVVESGGFTNSLLYGGEKRRLKVAAVLTAFGFRSHAHVLLENFLEPYLFNGKLTPTGMEVVSFYVDQFTERDMAREVAAKY